MENLAQRFALGVVRPLVDDGLLAAAAFGDLSGPVQQHGEVEAVKARFVEMPLVDVSREHSFAVPVGRRGVELTRATPGAVAVSVLSAAHHPLVVHRVSSSREASRYLFASNPLPGT